jgi:hypothetical protein
VVDAAGAGAPVGPVGLRPEIGAELGRVGLRSIRRRRVVTVVIAVVAVVVVVGRAEVLR